MQTFYDVMIFFFIIIKYIWAQLSITKYLGNSVSFSFTTSLLLKCPNGVLWSIFPIHSNSVRYRVRVCYYSTSKYALGYITLCFYFRNKSTVDIFSKVVWTKDFSQSHNESFLIQDVPQTNWHFFVSLNFVWKC